MLNTNSSDSNAEMAPGTTMSYDVTATISDSEQSIGTVTFDIVAQNNNEYFIDVDFDLNVESVLSIKMDAIESFDKSTGVIEGMTHEGEQTVSTIDGDKVLQVWVMSDEDATVKCYVDGNTDIIYKVTMESSEEPSMSASLAEKNMSWQDSYTQSSAIGIKNTYDVTGDYEGTVVFEVVGESDEGYCVLQDFDELSAEDIDNLYFMSEYTSGVPIGAEKTGQTVVIGAMTLDVWDYKHTVNYEIMGFSASYTLDCEYCVDSDMTVYRFVYDDGNYTIQGDLRE